METIGDRLKKAREATGMDQAQFASSIGISSRNTISLWERGQNYPPADVLQLIHEKYGINAGWLITGEGIMKGSTPHSAPSSSSDESLLQNGCLDIDRYGMIPLIEGWVRGGPEGEVLFEGIADHYPFKVYWLERLVGKSPERRKNLILVKVRGDSMSPTISHGEIALVDTYEAERIQVRTGRIYIVMQPDGTIVMKRLAISRENDRLRLICMSDNIAAYQPFDFEIPPDRRLKNYILGRVRWAGKEFD